jgi:hypothetical protein
MKKEQQLMRGEINSANSLIAMNTVWKKKYHKLQTRTIKCALLGRGEMFGDEELVKKESRRSFRALVKSMSISLIMIPLVKLLENAPDPGKFLETIAHHNLKQKWRSTLTRGIYNEIKDIEDHKRQELKEIKEIKEHLENHIPKNTIPIDNIKFDHRRVKSMKTASLGIVSVPVSPESERNTNPNKDYQYLPLPGKSKDLLRVIDFKQKTMKRSLFSHNDPLIHKPKHKPYFPIFEREHIIQDLKKSNAAVASPVATHIFDSETNFKDTLRTINNVETPRGTSKTNLTKDSPKIVKKKSGEFTKFNFMSPEEYPIRFMYNQDGTESPSTKIKNSIKRATKLWEKEYNLFIISPKKFNSQENISPNAATDFTTPAGNPSSNTDSHKLLKIEEISKIATKSQASSPVSTQKRKVGLTQDQKSKLQLYKTLKLEKIFAPDPQMSLEDYVSTVRNEIISSNQQRSGKSSALNALISPKSQNVSLTQTQRDDKKMVISNSVSQISLDPGLVFPVQSVSFRGRRVYQNKKI